LASLIERDEPARPGAEGDEAWRTMSDEDLAKRLESLRMRTKALTDAVGSVQPSPRTVDRGEMAAEYPEMSKLFTAVVSDWNAIA